MNATPAPPSPGGVIYGRSDPYDCYGAVAVSRFGRVGWSWGYHSQQEAEQRARTEAGDLAAYVYCVREGFIALARGADGQHYWDQRPWQYRQLVRAIKRAAGPGGKLICCFHVRFGPSE